LRRDAVKKLQERFSVSERRACGVLDQPRSSQRFEGKPKDEDERLTKRILEFVRQRPRWGYRRIGQLLKREGEVLNMKRVYRLWKAAGLRVPRKLRKKRATGQKQNACMSTHRAGTLQAERTSRLPLQCGEGLGGTEQRKNQPSPTSPDTAPNKPR